MNKAIRMVHYSRLAAFPIGLGLTSALVGGTLNRVMIVELGLPTALVGLFFAVPLLVSPLRVWLGYRSDAYPLWGLRREPYIVLGSLVAGIGVSTATLLALNQEAVAGAVAIGILLAFAAYGLGKNLASNTFEALLADRFEGDERPRAVAIFRVAMFVGIIGGAIGLGRLLEPFDPDQLTGIVFGVLGLAFVFAALAAFRQEPRTARFRQASEQARETSFREVVRTLVWPDPQVRLFFVVVMLAVLGTLAQDVLLEPYGALALGMSVAQTTRLTAIWGVGTVVAMLASGLWLVKRFGYSPVLRIGLILNVIVFAGIIATGALRQPGLFQALVFALGLGTGLSSHGLLVMVIEFTTPARAGLLMGVWGVAVQLGQAFGSLFGGGIVDVMRSLTGGNTLLAYSTVFAAEGVLLLVALGLFGRVNLAESAVLTEIESQK